MVELYRIIVWFRSHLSCIDLIEDEFYKSIHLKSLSRVWLRHLEPFIVEHSRIPHELGITSFFIVPFQEQQPSINDEMHVYIDEISQYFK